MKDRLLGKIGRRWKIIKPLPISIEKYNAGYMAFVEYADIAYFSCGLGASRMEAIADFKRDLAETCKLAEREPSPHARGYARWHWCIHEIEPLMSYLQRY